MKYWLLVLIFLFLMPFQAMGAQEINVDEVIQRLREVREKTKDFSADLIQEKKISLLKEKVVSKGRIRYKKPDHFFIEFFHPESSQMVFDGKTLLLYFTELIGLAMGHKDIKKWLGRHITDPIKILSAKGLM